MSETSERKKYESTRDRDALTVVARVVEAVRGGQRCERRRDRLNVEHFQRVSSAWLFQYPGLLQTGSTPGRVHILIDAASSLKAESLKRGLVVLLPRALCSSFVC